LNGGSVVNCNLSNFRGGDAVFMLGGILSNSVVAYGAWPEIATAVYCGAGGLITHCKIVNAYGGAIRGEGIYLDRSRLRNSFISGFLGGDEPAGGWAVDAHWSSIEGCFISPTSRSGGSGAFLDNCLM